MAEGEDEPRHDLLFSGLHFYLTSTVPSKAHYRERIEVNGGVLHQTDRGHPNIIILSDHLRSSGQVDQAVSYRYIDKCVENGALVDVDEHLIKNIKALNKPQTTKPKASNSRQTASSVAQAVNNAGPRPRTVGRAAYTTEEDNIILWWLQDVKNRSGNETYKKLEQAFPGRTWQSWRERWCKTLSKTSKHANGPVLPAEFDITKVSGWNPKIQRPNDFLDSPGGLDLTNAMDIANAHSTSPEEREDVHVLHFKMRPKHEKALLEKLEELILLKDDESAQDAIFSDLSEEFPERSPDQFRHWFFERILPNHVQTSHEPEQPNDENEDEPEPEESRSNHFSPLERSALYARFDELVLTDDDEERLEILNDLTDEFPTRSAQEFLDYYNSILKPVVKRLKKRGKVSTVDLEAAVLIALEAEENERFGDQPRRTIPQASNSRSAVPTNRKPDVRYEDLPQDETFVGTPGNSPNARQPSDHHASNKSSPASKPPVRKQVIAQASPKQKSPSTSRPAVLVYSPDRRAGQTLPKSTNITKSAVITSKPHEQVTASGTLTAGSKFPEVVDLIDEDDATPRQRQSQLEKFRASIYGHPSDNNGEDLGVFSSPVPTFMPSSNSKTTVQPSTRRGVPSSPPLMQTSGSIQPIQTSFKQPLHPSPLQGISRVHSKGAQHSLLVPSSSPGPSSDPMPYKVPGALPASSMKPIASRIPSSSLKRRHFGRSDEEMIIQSTPESKMFPPALTSSINSKKSDATIDQDEIQRSPLARKSRVNSSKRKRAEYDLPQETGDRTTSRSKLEGLDDEGDVNMARASFTSAREPSPILGDDESDSQSFFIPEPEDNSDDLVDFANSQMTNQPSELETLTIPELVVHLGDKYELDEEWILQAIMRTGPLRDNLDSISLAMRDLSKRNGMIEEFQWPKAAGVWDSQEDAILVGKDEDAIRALGEKHGEDRAYLRWKWLNDLQASRSETGSPS